MSLSYLEQWNMELPELVEPGPNATEREVAEYVREVPDARTSRRSLTLSDTANTGVSSTGLDSGSVRSSLRLTRYPSGGSVKASAPSSATTGSGPVSPSRPTSNGVLTFSGRWTGAQRHLLVHRVLRQLPVLSGVRQAKGRGRRRPGVSLLGPPNRFGLRRCRSHGRGCGTSVSDGPDLGAAPASCGCIVVQSWVYSARDLSVGAKVEPKQGRWVNYREALEHLVGESLVLPVDGTRYLGRGRRRSPDHVAAGH